ncbi:hypothetical protein ACROYT_G011889 [Oculina patagonica]
MSPSTSKLQRGFALFMKYFSSVRYFRIEIMDADEAREDVAESFLRCRLAWCKYNDSCRITESSAAISVAIGMESRPSEEEERIKKNNDVKEFIHTLDESMVRKLCIRSLRRGIGSMDYIHGLLIMEDDLEDESLNSSDIIPTPGTSTEEQLTSIEGTPGPTSRASSGSSTIP